jgi:hypothetical protein
VQFANLLAFRKEDQKKQEEKQQKACFLSEAMQESKAASYKKNKSFLAVIC